MAAESGREAPATDETHGAERPASSVRDGGDGECDRRGPTPGSETSHVPQYVAAAMACAVSLNNGLSYAWPSVSQPALQDANGTAPLAGGPLTGEQASWAASLLYLTAVASVPACVWAERRFSRKTLGYAAAAALFCHWLLLAATAGVEALLAARALAGVGAALLFFFTPTYIREVAENSVRGSVGTLMCVMFNVGVLLAYAVGGVISYQSFNLLGLALAGAFFVGFWWMPESPALLVARGRAEEAALALRWLRGPRADVAAELRALEGEVKRRRAEDAASLRQLLADRASARGLLLSSVLCANQPLCGFFVVLSYAVTIFTEASPEMSPNLAASIVGILLVAGSLLAARLVERLGRKVLFLTSDGIMAVCLAALGAYSYLQTSGVDVSHVNWVPVVSLSVFMAAVSLAITSLPFVVITEIFLPQAQEVAIIISVLIIQFIGFLATKFFTSFTQLLGLHGCYWLFSAICVVISVYLYIELPETKGRSLESIRKELAGKKDDSDNVQRNSARKESV